MIKVPVEKCFIVLLFVVYVGDLLFGNVQDLGSNRFLSESSFIPFHRLVGIKIIDQKYLSNLLRETNCQPITILVGGTSP